MAAFALTACSGDRIGGFGGLGGAGGDTASTPALAQPSAPPDDMAGRWLLMQAGGTQCNMNFTSASPSAVEGAIRPEGGCPGRLYMSRKWTFEQGQLVIRSHTSQPLAQLSPGGPGYEGKAASGESLTLQR